MTADLLIVVPVLGRPQNALPLAESVSNATTVPYRLIFMCSPGDPSQTLSCAQTGHNVEIVPWYPGRGDYARKINRAFTNSIEPWIFHAADDLSFHPGWDIAALTKAEREGADVVGTNDLGNPRVKSGKASTHSLVRRSYIEQTGGAWAEPGKVLHEKYWHNWPDEELVQLATKRGVFAAAQRSIVEHRHPHWGKAEMDATYELGLSRFHDDAALFRRRCRLWRRL